MPHATPFGGAPLGGRLAQRVAWQVAAPTRTVTCSPAPDRLSEKYTSAYPELSVCHVLDVPSGAVTVTVLSGWFECT